MCTIIHKSKDNQKMNLRNLLHVLIPHKSEIITLQGTTINHAEDFPNKIKKVYYEKLIDEEVQLYGYQGDILYLDVVCELENEKYVYYNRTDDWRYDTWTTKLVIGTTLDSVLDKNYVTSDIREKAIKKYNDEMKKP